MDLSNLYRQGQSKSKLSGLWKSWQFHCLTGVSQVKLEGILSHTTYPDKVMWCVVLCHCIRVILLYKCQPD